MERSHKSDHTQHKTVDQNLFRLQGNGGKKYDNKEANEVGNYDVLLESCPADVYDAKNSTWQLSHDKFHSAFAAFPWEVLEVFSPPPTVGFTWRHWGQFTGTYEEETGDGRLIELFGFGTATVNADLQLCDVELFFNPKEFISSLQGRLPVEDANRSWRRGSSHFETLVKEETTSS